MAQFQSTMVSILFLAFTLVVWRCSAASLNHAARRSLMTQSFQDTKAEVFSHLKLFAHRPAYRQAVQENLIKLVDEKSAEVRLLDNDDHPTFSPTFSPSFDSYCRTLVSEMPSNATSTSMCETCLQAGCSWCDSSEECFANVLDDDDDNCGSIYSGDSGICSVDLTALAIFIIVIIVIFGCCVPCVIIVGCIVLCCGATFTCCGYTFGQSRANATPTQQAYATNGNIYGSAPEAMPAAYVPGSAAPVVAQAQYAEARVITNPSAIEMGNVPVATMPASAIVFDGYQK